MSWIHIITILGFLFLCSEAVRILHETRVPAVSRLGNWPFFRQVASLRATWRFRKDLQEADKKFLSKNIPCRLEDPMHGSIVCLPTSCHPWLLAQPDTAIDRHALTWDFMMAQHFMWFSTAAPFHTPMHNRPSRQWLASRFDGPQHAELATAIAEELRLSLGREPEAWRTVGVYQTVADAVHRVTWALTVGEPLCRNKDLQQYGQMIFIATFLGGRVVDMSPSILRKAVLATVRQPARYLFFKLKAILAPEIRRREAQMAAAATSKETSEATGAQAHGEDMVTWSIAQERLENGGRPLDDDTVNKICSEVMTMIVASTHTLAITLSYTITSLLNASTHEKNYIEMLRQDIHRVQAESATGTWTRKSIAQLNLLDSAIRETMRLEPVSSVFPMWKVLPAQLTLTVPDGGPTISLKRGTRVCLPATQIHLSPHIYGPTAAQYDPFRFADRRLPVSTPSTTFLAWSIGRWACPGRYYAANTMKLVLVELLSRYEVELTEETRSKYAAGRESVRLGMSLNPDLGATMRVRFRG